MNISRSETDAASRREYWAPLLELSAQEVFGLMLGEGLDAAPEPAPENSLDVTSQRCSTVQIIDQTETIFITVGMVEACGFE